MKTKTSKAAALLASPWTAFGLLAILGALELASRSAAEQLGVYRAFDFYMRGPGLVVAALLAASAAAGASRLSLTRETAGLAAAYLGCGLLAAGLAAEAVKRRELMIALESGEPVSWAEDAQSVELALIDETEPATDRVYAVSERALRKRASLGPPRLPLRVRVHQFESKNVREQMSDAVADVEITEGPLSPAGGRWQLSMRGDAVRFEAAGRRWSAALRRRRRYLPFTMTLEDLRPELDPATGLARALTSRLVLSSSGPEKVSTGTPVRSKGMALYQAGASPDGRLSILEVVDERAKPLKALAWILALAGALAHAAASLAARRR